MASDDKMIITAAEAESLLHDGEYIHNFVGGGAMLIGCDFSREGAIQAFKDAVQIEIAGENCKRLKHPIAVWKSKNRVSFFEADMAKVEAFEAARLASPEVM